MSQSNKQNIPLIGAPLMSEVVKVGGKLGKKGLLLNQVTRLQTERHH